MTPSPDFPPFTCPGWQGLWLSCPPAPVPADPVSFVLGAVVLFVVVVGLLFLAALFFLLFVSED